jgi:cytochrome c oxidase assembly protein subunit 15
MVHDRDVGPFQRLALSTTGVTYFLILVGGLVRASGAGLGCPDWPRCFGSWIPPASAAELPPGFDPSLFNPTLMWTEYSNRLLGALVGILILATAVSAWRHHRRQPHIVWPVIAAVLLTGYQGWLGGRVVAHELAAWIVTVHMIVALIIVSLLLYATVYSLFARDGQPVLWARSRRGTARLIAVLIVTTLVQVGLGTQVRGHVDRALDQGVARTNALATVGALDSWHRDAALIVLMFTIVMLAIVAWGPRREPMLARAAWVVVWCAAAQIGIGLLLAYVSLTPWAQVAHLTVASLLLGAETVLLLFAWWLPSAGTAEAVPYVREESTARTKS